MNAIPLTLHAIYSVNQLAAFYMMGKSVVDQNIICKIDKKRIVNPKIYLLIYKKFCEDEFSRFDVL